MRNITRKRQSRYASQNKQKPSPKQDSLHTFLLFKPYGILCQFTDPAGRRTLSEFGSFPPDVYPAGRLDYDSEGLVLLTNDGALKHLLLDPVFQHPRTYLVQVERIPTENELDRLRRGVAIETIQTLPAQVEMLNEEPQLPERAVPIRFRKNVPTAWLNIVLKEGRNRQVRKMTAAIGHPTLRLVRIAIANLSIEGLKPGESRSVTREELTALWEILRQGNTKKKNPPRRPSSFS